MLASVLVIAASVGVSTLVVLQRVEQRSERAVMDLERDNAERMASLLVQRVVVLQKMLRATADSLPPAAATEPAAAGAALAANPALIVNFASVFLADSAGAVLAVHDGDGVRHPQLDMSGRADFRATLAQGTPQVSAPLIGRISRQPLIHLTMPVSGRNGQPAAVLGGSLRLASRNLFDDLTYAGSGGTDSVVTIVTDDRGIIISHPQRERVMRSIDTEPGLEAAVAHWVAQGRPVEPSGFVSHSANRFVAMAGVPGADWVVFRIAPDTELMGGLNQAQHEALLWAGGVALLGGLLILTLLAVLLGPLERLRQRAQALRGGQLPLDEGWPQTGGEIGELCRVLKQVLQERAQGEHAKQTLVQQMGSVLTAAPIGIAFTRQRRFELVGAEWGSLLGWDAQALVGREAREIYASENEYEALGPQVGAAFGAGRPYFGELQFRRRDGSQFWGRLQGRPVEAANADAGTIWLLEDVTERRETRERLSWSASHDALTRLFNRGAFEESLRAWLAASGSAAAPAAPAATATLLVLDLDRFKQVNDTAGHAAGDRVLRDVAAAMHEQVRAGDIAGRLGGDEFALLLPGCSAAVAMQRALRLRLAVSRIGIVHGSQHLTVDASIGLVEIDAACGTDAAAWLARADAACYAAKHAGRGCVRLAGDGGGTSAEAVAVESGA